jgi:hypothetical protein
VFVAPDPATATTKPAPVNTCAHPTTPAQAAKCPAPHPTGAAPHPRLLAAAGVSCGYLKPSVFRIVARFTFDSIGSDWRVTFSDTNGTAAVSGNTVTVTEDMPDLSGVANPTNPPSSRLDGALYFFTPGGDAQVPVGATVTCH